MKKQYNLLLVLILGGIAFFTSCEDNLLDREPLSSITPEQYLWDESQLAAYSINRYGTLPTHGSWSFGTFGIDANTDNQASISYDNKYAPGQWRVGQSGGEWDFWNINQCNLFSSNRITTLESRRNYREYRKG